MSITHLRPGVRFCAATIHGNTVYVAGQVADKAKGKSVREQTEDILSIIDSILADAGSSKSKMLMVNIWLTDMSTFAEMNAAWDAWIDKSAMPGRATVEAKLAAPDYKVEIAVIAAR